MLGWEGGDLSPKANTDSADHRWEGPVRQLLPLCSPKATLSGGTNGSSRLCPAGPKRREATPNSGWLPSAPLDPSVPSSSHQWFQDVPTQTLCPCGWPLAALSKRHEDTSLPGKGSGGWRGPSGEAHLSVKSSPPAPPPVAV